MGNAFQPFFMTTLKEGKKMNLTKIVEKPIFKTRIISSSVKVQEMLLGYFLAPFCAMISNAIFGSYLNRYYADIIGWTEFGVFSTLLPIVSVIFVVAGNLFVGQLMERTRTSQGKARPYLLLSAPIVALAVVLLFMTPTGSSPIIQMIWIALSYNLYYAIAYPMFYTAHSSMVAVSTRNSESRGLLSTFSNAAMVASAGVGASIVVPVLLQSYLFVANANGGYDIEASLSHWRLISIVLCLLSFFGILVEYYFTRERITEESIKLNLKEEKIPVKKQLAACVKERYWWIIILYFFLFQLGGLVKNSSMSFYARWMFDSVVNVTDTSGIESAAGAVMSTLGLIGGIPTAIGMLVAFPIANKLGKQRAVCLGLIISVLGSLVSFIDVHNVAIVCAGIVLKGIGTIPASYVTLALLADVLDHMEAKNGFRCDGITMSIYGAIMIGLAGLGTGIINGLLSFSGYVSAGHPVDLEAYLAGGEAAALLDRLSSSELLQFIAEGGQVVYRQLGGTEQVLAFTFLGLEPLTFVIIIVMMSFLNVEKYIADDQKLIIEHQKEAVLASGGVWVDPKERMRLEQEAAEKAEEEERIKELKTRCEKRGLNFEEEEAKYQKEKADKKARELAKENARKEKKL